MLPVGRKGRLLASPPPGPRRLLGACWPPRVPHLPCDAGDDGVVCCNAVDNVKELEAVAQCAAGCRGRALASQPARRVNRQAERWQASGTLSPQASSSDGAQQLAAAERADRAGRHIKVAWNLGPSRVACLSA